MYAYKCHICCLNIIERSVKTMAWMQWLLTHLPAESQETYINGNADRDESVDELKAGQSSWCFKFAKFAWRAPFTPFWCKIYTAIKIGLALNDIVLYYLCFSFLNNNKTPPRLGPEAVRRFWPFSCIYNQRLGSVRFGLGFVQFLHNSWQKAAGPVAEGLYEYVCPILFGALALLCKHVKLIVCPHLSTSDSCRNLCVLKRWRQIIPKTRVQKYVNTYVVHTYKYYYKVNSHII